MSQNTPENYEDQYQELALRALTNPFDPRVDKPELLLAQLPSELPFELPIPEGSRLLGSLRRGPENIEVFLDSPLSTKEVHDFYRARLQAEGWQELEMPMGPHMGGLGGFAHTGMPRFDTQVIFSHGSRGPVLTVRAFEQAGMPVDVRLDLNANSQFSLFARQMKRQRMPGMGIRQLIPLISPPVGAKQFDRGGGSSGMDNVYSTATLVTDIDLATLATHYTSELERAGWVTIEEGLNGPLAWSTWTFRDEDNEPWRGMFLILKTPGREREHFLYVKVDWDRKDEGGMSGGGGGFSYAPMFRIG